MSAKISIDREALASFCRRHRIRRLSLVESALREDFGPDSDVDLLVEFEPGGEPGLIALAAMESALSDLLGREVDLRTAEDLSRHFRDEVVHTAEVQYVAR